MYSITLPQKVGGLTVSRDWSEKIQMKGKKREIRLDATGEAVFIRTGRPFKIKRGTERKKNSTSLLPIIDDSKCIPPL